MDPTTSPAGPATPASPEQPFRLRYAAVSDVGRHRKENQDSGYASEHLLVVADGVGGAAYGDVASATAVQLLRRLDDASARTPGDSMLPALAGAVHRVHDRLAEMVEQDAELDGTSTTVTASLFDGHRFGFVHVGDSRGYLWRRGDIRQLTKDHTFVQTLVDEGRISEAESRVHPHRNIILRAVDGVHDTEPDLFNLEAEPGDRILLCSDGCSGAVSDEQMASVLGSGSVDSAAVGLVQAALEGGTTDNVTVVVAEVVPADAVDEVETSAAMSVGPMLVGAAASQPRRGLRSRFRGRPAADRSGADTADGEDHHTVAVDGAAPPARPGAGSALDAEELRYAPRPPRRHPMVRRLAFVLIPVLLVVGAAYAAYAWSQHQYYVAVDGAGVAIYKGVEVDVPGLHLSDVYEEADFALADLPEFSQEKVRDGIVADDLTDAHRVLRDLAKQADTLAAQEAAAKRQQEKAKKKKAQAHASASPSASPTGGNR